MSDASATVVAVLVVEDDPSVYDLVETALADAGYKVLTAGSANKAIEHLAMNKAIKALVTDVELGPGPSGWDIATRARELHPEMAVIYMTGAAAGDWPSKGVPNSLIIQKPFAPAQVVTAVSQLLNAPPTLPQPAN
jgi:DNA-binding NtrC family response regulator